MKEKILINNDRNEHIQILEVASMVVISTKMIRTNKNVTSRKKRRKNYAKMIIS